MRRGCRGHDELITEGHGAARRKLEQVQELVISLLDSRATRE